VSKVQGIQHLHGKWIEEEEDEEEKEEAILIRSN
jgi:hypothetical protein